MSPRQIKFNRKVVRSYISSCDDETSASWGATPEKSKGVQRTRGSFSITLASIAAAEARQAARNASSVTNQSEALVSTAAEALKIQLESVHVVEALSEAVELQPEAVSAASDALLEVPTDECALVDLPQEQSIKRKARKGRATSPLEEVLSAKYLSVKQMPRRYPGVTEAAIRHAIFKSEPERRNPSNGHTPQGFAACIVRPSERKILIDCESFEKLLSETPQFLR